MSRESKNCRKAVTGGLVVKGLLATGLMTGIAFGYGDPDTFAWQDALHGNWSCSDCWSPAGPPMALDDSAMIDATGANYTVTLDEAPTISDVTLDSVNARLLMIGTTRILTVDTASILAGEIQMQSGADILCDGLFTVDGANSYLEMRGGAFVSCGSMAVSGAGIAEAAAATSLYQCMGDVTITSPGLLRVAPGATMICDIQGQINGPGSFQVEGLARVMNLTVGDTATLEMASGSIVRGNTGTEMLHNDGVVRGAGELGQNLLGIHNTVVIEGDLADPNPPLVIDANDAGVDNDGTIRAGVNGRLEIQDSIVDNTGGMLQALDGGELMLGTGVEIDGGVLNTEGLGVIRDIAAGPCTVLNNVVVDGRLDLADGADMHATGTMEILGLVSLSSEGAPTSLRFADGMNLTGTGEIAMSDNANNTLGCIDDGGTFTLTEVEVRGSGNIGGDSCSIINAGGIVADQPTTLTIDPADAGMVDNQGSLKVTSGSTLNIAAGGFVNNSEVDIADGGVLMRDGEGLDFVMNAGTALLNGEIQVVDDAFILNGGLLVGNGIVRGDLNNEGGVIAPGLSPGRLTVDGDLNLELGGTLEIELVGTEEGDFDVIEVIGKGNQAAVSGRLSVILGDEFVPVVGDEWIIIEAPAVTPTFFDCADFPKLPEGRFRVDYRDDNVRLYVDAGEPCPSDVNDDGVVDTNDLLSLLATWGPVGACSNTDMNDDGVVDTGDLLFLLGEWGPCNPDEG